MHPGRARNPEQGRDLLLFNEPADSVAIVRWSHAKRLTQTAQSRGVLGPGWANRHGLPTQTAQSRGVLGRVGESPRTPTQTAQLRDAFGRLGDWLQSGDGESPNRRNCAGERAIDRFPPDGVSDHVGTNANERTIDPPGRGQLSGERKTRWGSDDSPPLLRRKPHNRVHGTADRAIRGGLARQTAQRQSGAGRGQATAIRRGPSVRRVGCCGDPVSSGAAAVFARTRCAWLFFDRSGVPAGARIAPCFHAANGPFQEALQS